MVYILLHRGVITGVYASVDRAKSMYPAITDWEYNSSLDQWSSAEFDGFVIQTHPVRGNLHESCG